MSYSLKNYFVKTIFFSKYQLGPIVTSQFHRPCKFFSIFLRGLIYVVSEGIPFYKVIIAVQCLWKFNNWTPTLYKYLVFTYLLHQGCQSSVSWVANDPTQKFHLHIYFLGPFLASTATGWVPQKILSCRLPCCRCVEDAPGISSYRRKRKEAKLARRKS